MKALVYVAPEKMEVQDIPRPAPQPGEALLRVSGAGICGSDLHGFLGHSERRKPGLVFGHEAVATIADVHPSVKDWRPGQRVCVNPLISCGACPACLAGRQNLCASWRLFGMDRLHGTYAEYLASPVTQLHALSDSITDAAAVLTEPLANIVHFYRISMTGLPGSAAIFGAGTIGTLALLMAKLSGIPRVCVIDRNEKRLEVVKELGADHVVNSDREDAAAAVRRFTDGEGAEYVIDAVGHAPTRRAAAAACRRGGRLLFIGMAENESALPWIEMIRDEKAVFTTFAYTPMDFATSLKLLEARRIDLTRWTEAMPLERGQEGFMKMTYDPGPTMKLMLKIGS